jgi:hypothetical protein
MAFSAGLGSRKGIFCGGWSSVNHLSEGVFNLA